jgi:hypothetical protein
LHLRKKVAALFRAQIDQEKRGVILLENSGEPIRFCNMAKERAGAKKGAAPPNEIVILRVKKAGR